tara:strand:+ start:362 stop:538 length:177 start_codon:yes stop_codon:yes gene_type:complete
MTDKEINKVAINLTALAFAKLTNEDKEKRVFELAEIIGIKKLVLLNHKRMLKKEELND